MKVSLLSETPNQHEELFKTSKSIYPNFYHEKVNSFVELWIKLLCMELHYKAEDEMISADMKSFDIDEVQEQCAAEVSWRRCQAIREEIENIWQVNNGVEG